MASGVPGLGVQMGSVPLPARVFNPCELCNAPARVLCPSDDAFLCRRCDCLVHGANFLVARHRRAFLCRSCASPTASGASGASLPAANLLCVCCSLASVHAEVSCGSRSEGSSCSELTSDCDSERESSASAAGAFSRKRKGARFNGQEESVFDSSVSSSVVDEEEELSSGAGVGLLSFCGGEEEAHSRVWSHPKDSTSYSRALWLR